MSDNDTAGVSGQNAQINGPSAGPAAPLSAEFVSNTIKDAFGSFKNYLDSSIQKVKEDSEKKLDAASSDLQQMKRAQELSFRSKGHRLQFEFNANLQDKLEKGVALYEEDKWDPALVKIKEAIAEVKKRNKLIRLADKSDAGWQAVDEYLSDDIASDSNDERGKDPLQLRVSRGDQTRIAGLAMQAHLIVAIIFFVALSNEIDNRLGLLEPPVAGAPDPAVAAPSRPTTASPAIVRGTGVETALVSTTKCRGQQTKMAAPSSDSYGVVT